MYTRWILSDGTRGCSIMGEFGPRWLIGGGPRTVDPYRVARVQAELGRRAPAELDPGRPARVQPHVHPHLEPEMGDPVDPAGLAAQARVAVDHQVVGPDPLPVELGRRTEELHDELVLRLVVNLGGRADSLEPPVIYDGPAGRPPPSPPPGRG